MDGVYEENYMLNNKGKARPKSHPDNSQKITFFFPANNPDSQPPSRQRHPKVKRYSRNLYKENLHSIFLRKKSQEVETISQARVQCLDLANKLCKHALSLIKEGSRRQSEINKKLRSGPCKKDEIRRLSKVKLTLWKRANACNRHVQTLNSTIAFLENDAIEDDLDDLLCKLHAVKIHPNKNKTYDNIQDIIDNHTKSVDFLKTINLRRSEFENLMI